MANDINLGAELELKGLSQFLTGLKKVQGEGGKAKRAVSFAGVAKGFRHVGGAVRGTGRALAGFGKMVGGFTLGLGAGVGKAVASFGEFELQIARIGTLLEPGRDAMKDFGALVNKSSVQFGQDAGVMADAVFQAISAGVDPATKSVEEFTNVVGKAATGGFVDAATVVDGLTTVLNAFGSEVGTATDVSDRFFIANKLGKTTFEELSKSIGRVAPTAKALGVSFDEVLAATVSLTKGGTNTAEVMSGLKAVFSSVKSVSKDAQKVASDLGIDFSLQGLKAKGLAGFMQELTDKTNGDTVAQAKLFGSIEAFNAIARLASKEGAKDFDDALKQLKGSTGATTQAFDRVANTTGFKLKQLKQGFSRFTREIGEGLAEGFGLNKIKDMPDAIDKAAKAMKKAAKAFAGGFKSILAPAKSLEGMNLEDTARKIGEAVGKMVNGLMDMIKVIPGVVSALGDIAQQIGNILSVMGKVWGFLGGRNPAAENAKEFGKAGGAKFVGNVGKVASVDLTDAVLKGEYGNEAKKNLQAYIKKHGVGTGTVSQMGVVAATTFGGLLSGKGTSKVGEDFDKARYTEGTRRAAAQLINRFGEQNYAEGQRRAEIKRGAQARKTGEGVTYTSLNVPGGLGYGKMEATPINMEFDLTLKTQVDDGRKKPESEKKKRYGARGRGSAKIESTVRQRYVVFADSIAPIADDFVYSHLLAGRQG